MLPRDGGDITPLEQVAGPPVSPRENPLAGWRLPEKREAAPAALQPRLSAQMKITGRICRIGPGLRLRFLPRPGLRPSGSRLTAVIRSSGPTSPGRLLTHPPGSAEPAGAVSGLRYGPMRENPGLQRPLRSRRPCRAGHGAPRTPAVRLPGCKAQRRFACRASRRCGGSLLISTSGAVTRFSPCRRGLIQPQPATPVQGEVNSPQNFLPARQKLLRSAPDGRVRPWQ